MIIIRPSLEQDLPAITAIYAHHVLTGTGTFETDAAHAKPTWRRAAPTCWPRACPTWSPTRAGRCWASPIASGSSPGPPIASRPRIRSTCTAKPRGKGLGRSLLAELTCQAEAAGIRKLIAVIGDSANAGSIGVHRSLGFSQVGVFKSCGWKFGKWLDIVLMEKSLGEGDTTSPEPTP